MAYVLVVLAITAGDWLARQLAGNSALADEVMAVGEKARRDLEDEIRGRP